MTIPSRSNRLIYPSNISRLQTLISNLQRWNHTLVQNGGEDEHINSRSNSRSCYDYIDRSSWRKVNARVHGIDREKVSQASDTALFILRKKGFEAYLVGGCVRDLLLDRIPKDFDVITSATLKEIKTCFHRARVVGNRFPICHVYIKGSMVEVSSFDTLGKDADSEKKVSDQTKPSRCSKADFMRWQNCLRRDFTINSLFYDPSANRIYDYTNGMRDLKLCKVQTVIPANLSFKEDCARILRGLRIAARLRLSFSAETATAIKDLYMSIMDLDKRRLELEMDYMFSYGAAESSLCLLQRFKILDILLPFQAAYLSEQGHDQNAQSSMLCKLFSSMDKLLACDRPCTSSLWIGVLAIHLALVNHPQDALVVWTFSSALYYGNWENAVEVAREKSQCKVALEPEIGESCCTKSDKELAEDVNHFVSQVISSIDALTESQCLVQSIARYPHYPCSDFVCISRAKGRAAAKVFKSVLENVKSLTKNRKSFEIDYELLRKGHWVETAFVLGKIMMDTMNSGVVQYQQQQTRILSSKVVEESKIRTLCQHDQRQVLGSEKDCSQKFTNQNQMSNADFSCHLLSEKKKRNVTSNADQQQVDENESCIQHPNATRMVITKGERVLTPSHFVQKDEGSFPIINFKQVKKKVKEDEHQQLGSHQEHLVKKPHKQIKKAKEDEHPQPESHEEHMVKILHKQIKKAKEDEHQQPESHEEYMVKIPHKQIKKAKEDEHQQPESHEEHMVKIPHKQIKKAKVDEHQQPESHEEHMVKIPHKAKEDEHQQPESHEKHMVKKPHKQMKKVKEDEHQQSESIQEHTVKKPHKQIKKAKEDEHQQPESIQEHMVKKPLKISNLFI